MPRLVISDTSPLRYLILIGQADLLPALYSEILIPQAFASDLEHPSTPEPVRLWLAHRPSWLQVVPLTIQPASPPLADLDPGEQDAILLALHLHADLVLMDDREGVQQARRLGLAVTGALGVLDHAAQRGLLDLAPAIAPLRLTNFRVDPALLDRLLAGDGRRRKK